MLVFSLFGCVLGSTKKNIATPAKSSSIKIPGRTIILSELLIPSPSKALVTIEPVHITLTPAITDTLYMTSSPTIDPLACVPRDEASEYGLVKWIPDGGSIVVDIRGRLHTVRYLGIDAPGLVQPIEYMGPSAARFNATVARNQLVRMVKDGVDRDCKGRLLRYVFVGDLFVNFELVRHGLARVVKMNPSIACNAIFMMAEDIAAQELLGIWEPTPIPHQTLTVFVNTTTTIPPTIPMFPTVTIRTAPTFTSTPVYTSTSTLTPTPTVTITITSTISPTLQATGTASATTESSLLNAGNAQSGETTH